MAVSEEVMRCAGLVHRLAELHRLAAFAALAEAGVSESASGLLQLLGSAGPVSMGTVAHHLLCDASNVTLLAAHLEGLGLAQRVEDADDRRRRLLHLTERGQQVHAQMLSAVNAASPLSALSNGQLAELAATLEPLVGEAS